MTSTFDRRFTPARPDLAAEKLRGVVDAPRYVPPRRMRVVEELVSMSREPSRAVGIDTQALFGEAIDVYEIDDEGWAWGQLAGDGYVGFVPAEGLREAAATPGHRVGAPRTFVYPGPDMKLPPMRALPMGAQAVVVEERGDFARLEAGGFVWRAHLVELRHRENDFVAVAERFVGVPYLWGGKTFSGLDCSGLVQVSLAACGVAAPRDTDVLQAGVGAPVAIEESLNGLRRGDLVFWKGHVGLMRDESILLHANGHHMATVIEPLSQAARRIRKSGGGASATGPEISAIKRLPSPGATTV